MTKKLLFFIFLSGLLFLTACNLEDAVSEEPDDTGVKAFISTSTVEGDSPLEVTFDGSNSSSTNGTISTFAWNFGDGSYGDGSKVTHTFLKAGKYTVSLTVTDSKGGNNAATTTIVVTLGEKIYVNASYTGSTSTGNQTAPYKTISEALNVASDTQTIQILAGTYNESITMKVGVTLAGESSDTVIIIPSGDTGITIDNLNSQAVISGITIKNATKNGIYCGLATNLKITNCVFQSNTVGIRTVNNSDPVISNCSFKSNETALYLENNSSPTISDCTIENNVRGVFVDNNAAPRFSNCSISNNSGSGVVIENYSTPTLDTNTVSSNGNFGVKISESSTPIFSSNQISLNGDYDVKCSDNYSNFTDNGGNTIGKCGSCLACSDDSILQVAGKYSGSCTKTDGTTALRALEITQTDTNLTIKIYNQEGGVIPSSPNDTGTAVLKAGETTTSFTSSSRGDVWSLDFSTSGKITGTQKIASSGSTVTIDLTKVSTKSLKWFKK